MRISVVLILSNNTVNKAIEDLVISNFEEEKCEVVKARRGVDIGPVIKV